MRSVRRRSIRSDAHRNRAAIITATVQILQDDPAASVAAIAASAGVSRATLYGHFPSRRALVAQALRQTLGEADRQLASIDPAASVQQSLDDIVATSWRVLADAAGIAAAARVELSPFELRRLHEVPLARIAPMLRRGREDGVFRTDHDLGWQTECFYAVLQAGTAQVRRGGATPTEAACQMASTIRAMLAVVPSG